MFIFKLLINIKVEQIMHSVYCRPDCSERSAKVNLWTGRLKRRAFTAPQWPNVGHRDSGVTAL